MTFHVSSLSSVYTKGILIGSLMNSKATAMVITSQENSLSKTFWWGMAKAGSCQRRSSTFGEQLFRNTITKICCSKSEAQFKILVSTQYLFLNTERCLFTFLHAYSVNILLGRGVHLCTLYFWRHSICCAVSLGDRISKSSFGLFPLCLLPSFLFMKPLQSASGGGYGNAKGYFSTV